MQNIIIKSLTVAYKVRDKDSALTKLVRENLRLQPDNI